MRIHKTLASVALLAAMAVPVVSFAAPMPQDHHDRDRRYYDREHHDYHHWDTREDAAYRHWMETNHRRYVDYGHLRAQDQRRYWEWRHDHPEWRP